MERTAENIQQNKNSFILYLDNEAIFNALDDENAGKLIKALFKFVHTGEDPQLDPLLNMAFIPIKQSFKRDLLKWRDRADRSRENGKKGGRPKNPVEPKKPSGLKKNPKEPKKPDSVSGSVSVSVNDSDNENKEKKFSHGEHKNVSLTNDENLKLQTKLGLDLYGKCIEKLSSYKKSNGKKYKSDYATINNWVITSVNEQAAKENKVTGKQTKGEVNLAKANSLLRK